MPEKHHTLKQSRTWTGISPGSKAICDYCRSGRHRSADFVKSDRESVCVWIYGDSTPIVGNMTVSSIAFRVLSQTRNPKSMSGRGIRFSYTRISPKREGTEVGSVIAGSSAQEI
jgi:hypothetical protein